MDRPFLPVNLKWLKSKHYLHHYHSLLHHQGSVHHSWWLCRYDNFAIVFFYVWFNVIPEKQVNSHFCITVEYHFSNTLRKRNSFRLKKTWSSVQSFIFYNMERCHLYNASGKATGYKNRDEGVIFVPLRPLAA